MWPLRRTVHRARAIALRKKSIFNFGVDAMPSIRLQQTYRWLGFDCGVRGFRHAVCFDLLRMSNILPNGAVYPPDMDSE